MFTTGRQLSLILGFLLKVRLGELVRSLGPSLVTQTVKNLSAMQETLVQSLDQEDPLEKGMGLPPPEFLPGESDGQMRLVGATVHWDPEESDPTERLHFHFLSLKGYFRIHLLLTQKVH